MMRIRLFSLAAALLLSASLHAAPTTLDRIVAVANDDIVLSSELENAMVNVTNQMRAQNKALPPRAQIEKQLLERLILTKIQMQRAKKIGISIDNNTLNKAVRDIAQKQGMSMVEFVNKVKQQGVNYATFRDSLRDELTIEELIKREVHRRIGVSKDEVDDVLNAQSNQGQNANQYRLHHILIATPDNASDEVLYEARSRAQKIINELEQGANFKDLARALSKGPTAKEGGDLGWRKANELPSLFATELATLEKNQIRGPLASPSGYHIIKLADIKNNGISSSQEVRSRHILISPKQANGGVKSDREMINTLLDIRQQVLNGADFAKLAKKHSMDPGSAAKGGNLGWQNPGIFVDEFAKVLRNLKANEISQPFRTQYGWHIAQVQEKRTLNKADESLRNQIRQRIGQRKMIDEMQLWEQRLRDEAYVEYRL